MMHGENDQIISDETTIADTTSKHFVNISNKLKHKPKRLKQRSLCCQKYSIDARTMKELLKSDE